MDELAADDEQYAVGQAPVCGQRVDRRLEENASDGVVRRLPLGVTKRKRARRIDGGVGLRDVLERRGRG